MVDVLALALAAFALSIWIVVPGPVPTLFLVSVGATELWPLLALINVAILMGGLRSRSRWRCATIALASGSLLCSLVPPTAYAFRGPRVPISALLTPWPIAEPKGSAAQNAPTVLAIYGGAWERGSPRNDARLNERIASWGYNVRALDYPHSPAFRWPAQRDAIVRQIDAIRDGKLILLGHSSGAQLALIAGALRPKRISGIITYESPVDLKLGYEFPMQPDIINARQITSDLCGGPPQRHPACYRSASPRYVVHHGMPPVLMLAGARDHVIDPQLQQVLRDTMRSDGIRVKYVELPWADHSFETVSYGFHNRIAMWYVRNFIDQVAKTTSRGR